MYVPRQLLGSCVALGLLMAAGCAEEHPIDRALALVDDAGDVGADTLPDDGDVNPDGRDVSDGSDQPDGSDPPTPAIRKERLVVLQVATVARIQTGNISVGVDLDNRVSGRTDFQGCRKVDFTSPDGTPGIDNQFGTLMPAMELTALGAMETLIQTAMNNGQLLLMLQVQDLDDPLQDDTVRFNVARGLGVPAVGNDGRIEPGQTFDKNIELPWSFDSNARMIDGVLHAGPLDVDIQMEFFSNDILLRSRNTQFRVQLHDDGTATGFFAGALRRSEIIEMAEGLNDANVVRLLDPILSNALDLSPDENGNCTELSVVLEFEATPAYFFEDIDSPEPAN